MTFSDNPSQYVLGQNEVKLDFYEMFNSQFSHC